MAGICWIEDLPPEIVTLIWRRLPWHTARFTFRAVCRAWRHMPTPTPLPSLCFNTNKFQSFANGELPYRFAPADQNRTGERCYGCYDNWFLLCNWPGNAGRSPTFSLSNPLSGATIEGIPLYSDDTKGIMGFPMPKVIVCSPDLVVALLCCGSVAFYRPGALLRSVSPSVEAGSWRRLIRDITLYRGKVYAIDNNDNIFVHELGGNHGNSAGAPKKPRCAARHVVMTQPSNTSKEAKRWMRYLVVCRDNLLMVRWSVPSGNRSSSSAAKATKGVKLRVFQADLDMGRWLEVEDLGDHALFIGPGCSKALRLTGDDQRFQGNRVYFLGYDLLGSCRPLTYGDSPTYGFYDLTSCKITQIFLTGKWNVWPQHSMEWFFP
ncbi:hypothetical protein EJB05_29431, partial [Eragrostis curvula]